MIIGLYKITLKRALDLSIKIDLLNQFPAKSINGQQQQNSSLKFLNVTNQPKGVILHKNFSIQNYTNVGLEIYEEINI